MRRFTISLIVFAQIASAVFALVGVVKAAARSSPAVTGQASRQRPSGSAGAQGPTGPPRRSGGNGTGLYNNLINVTDAAYGAKGDGVTDDTAAIKNAIRASCAAANHPDVYLPAPSNCYKITSPIHVGCSGIAVHGQQGPGASKICSNYWGPVMMVESTGDNLLEYGPGLIGAGRSLNTKSFPTDGKGFITLNEVLGYSAQNTSTLAPRVAPNPSPTEAIRYHGATTLRSSSARMSKMMTAAAGNTTA